MPEIGSGQRSNKLPSAGIGNATSETQFAGSDAALLICYLPGGNKLNRRHFRIRCGGRVSPGTSGNFTVSLYFGTSSTIASNTKIATTGAVNAAAAGNWSLEAECFYDSTSGRIEGLLKGFVYATAVAQAILTNAATSVDLSTDGGNNGLTLTGLFGSTNASNTAFVDVFEVVPL